MLLARFNIFFFPPPFSVVRVRDIAILSGTSFRGIQIIIVKIGFRETIQSRGLLLQNCEEGYRSYSDTTVYYIRKPKKVADSLSCKTSLTNAATIKY